MSGCLFHTLLHSYFLFLLVAFHHLIVKHLTKLLCNRETNILILAFSVFPVLLYHVGGHCDKFLFHALDYSDLSYHIAVLIVDTGKTTYVASLSLKGRYCNLKFRFLRVLCLSADFCPACLLHLIV